ncbi:group 1 truncated hemoglobin [Mycobacterium sp. 1274756.6]|uniref:group I truncated hemoglobin n=1 Tax=Mycobacterium sp. 1274756.6 TaxID=1834076 RepID=UPI0008000729|nr:group 1 truncated hemoglobin [Mycobacterium sp. 1274756.6]OBJ67464.1 hemin receptor [Mycobacterium sp. 1274756.6]
MSTLYDRIGGHETLETVVPRFYDRVLADDALSGFFAGVNMQRQIGKQIDFLAAAMGGPLPYTGPSLKQAHRGRGIRLRHFTLVAEHLIAAFRDAGVSATEIDDIVALLAPLAADIASDAPKPVTGPLASAPAR